MTVSTPSAGRLEAALGDLLPAGVAVGVWCGTDEEAPPLGPLERAAIERAVPERRREFAWGRAAARSALRRAGFARDAVEIPVGPSREPLWPSGYIGSITHCGGLVSAIASVVTPDLAGIGLDAELARPLPEDVGPIVLTASEARFSGTVEGTVVFSAKEAIHKVVFPRHGIWLDFADVALDLDEPEGAFRAAHAPGAAVLVPDLERLVGRYRILDGYVLTVAWLPGSGLSAR